MVPIITEWHIHIEKGKYYYKTYIHGLDYIEELICL